MSDCSQERISKLANDIYNGVPIRALEDDELDCVIRAVVHKIKQLPDPRNKLVSLTCYSLPAKFEKIYGIIISLIKSGADIEDVRQIIFFGLPCDMNKLGGCSPEDLIRLNDLGFNIYISNSSQILESL